MEIGLVLDATCDVSRALIDEHGLEWIGISAEAGSAWTIEHPEFDVVIPRLREGREHVVHPVGFAVRKGNDEFAYFLERWVQFRIVDKTIQQLYGHWILGEGAQRKSPRWCILRDELHWID